MRKNDLAKMLTKKVNEYLTSDYYYALSNGTQGETLKVDITNGKETIRFRLSSFYESWNSGLDLVVEKFNKANGNTLWNGKGEILESKRFYCVSNGMYDMNAWFVSDKNEFDKIKNIQNSRFNCIQYMDNRIVNDKYKKIAIKFINRQPRCKTKKYSDITYISKRDHRYLVHLNNGNCYVLR